MADFELDVWGSDKPISKNTSTEVQTKLNKLNDERDYLGILEFANTLQNNKETYLIRANANLSLHRWK